MLTREAFSRKRGRDQRVCNENDEGGERGMMRMREKRGRERNDEDEREEEGKEMMRMGNEMKKKIK